MYYKLVALNSIDQLERTSWMLHLPSTIGRNPENDVSINHDSISRAHCRLTLGGDGVLTVRDLNSMNGTYVGDNKVKRAELKPGDILQLGAISFRVEYVTEKEDVQADAKPQTFDLSVTVPMNVERPPTPLPPPSPVLPPKKWWQFW